MKTLNSQISYTLLLLSIVAQVSAYAHYKQRPLGNLSPDQTFIDIDRVHPSANGDHSPKKSTSVPHNTIPAASLLTLNSPHAAAYQPLFLEKNQNQDTNSTCKDDIDGCIQDFCDIYPDAYYPLCKKTCNNCDGTICADAKDVPCHVFKEMDRCDQVQGVCSLTCNQCPPGTFGHIEEEEEDAPEEAQPIHEQYGDFNGTCDDEFPTCSIEQCLDSPGFFLFMCKKTCQNCDGSKCFDKEGYNCARVQERGLCDFEESYCPKTCGICTGDGNLTAVADQVEQVSECVDYHPDCSNQKCQEFPGVYLSACKKTCNNCDESQCFDQVDFDCESKKDAGLCYTVRAQCPKTCEFCTSEEVIQEGGEILEEDSQVAAVEEEDQEVVIKEEDQEPVAQQQEDQQANVEEDTTHEEDDQVVPEQQEQNSPTVEEEDQQVIPEETNEEPITQEEEDHPAVEETPPPEPVQECRDEISGCSLNTCQSQPGYYLSKCKKTCNNCDESQCYDNPTYPCQLRKNQGLCSSVKSFCPLTCGQCTPKVENESEKTPQQQEEPVAQEEEDQQANVEEDTTHEEDDQVVPEQQEQNSPAVEEEDQVIPQEANEEPTPQEEEDQQDSTEENNTPEEEQQNLSEEEDELAQEPQTQEQEEDQTAQEEGTPVQECTDEYPYCRLNLCESQPGYYLPICKKTCNNCDGSQCYDNPTYPCQLRKDQGLCSSVKRLCPLTCGECTPKTENESEEAQQEEEEEDQQSNVEENNTPEEEQQNSAEEEDEQAQVAEEEDTPIQECTDEYPYCRLSLCESQPGYYLPICKKTCNNCDGSECYDREGYPCQTRKNQGLCSSFKTFCPKTCGFC